MTEGQGAAEPSAEGRSVLDLATVIYEPELLLLQLQARSIERFFDESGLGKIYLIVNEREPARLMGEIARIVLPEYGRLRDRVQLVAGGDLLDMSLPANGWRKQQTLKLLISRCIEADTYVVLDGKNHFIKPVGIGSFIHPDGRMASFRTRQHGSLNQYFLNAFRYFQLDPVPYSDSVMPATTPYVLSRDIVRNMIGDIERREGIPFDAFFHAPGRDVTEFFLHFAYLVFSGADIDALYEFGRRTTVTLFTRWPEDEAKLHAAIAKLTQKHIIMFGLHKNRVSNLNDEARAAICAHWTSVGLFTDQESALEFMSRLNESTGGKPLATLHSLP